MVLTKKKHPFEKIVDENKVPAILTLQVYDNDTFSRDDFLGTLNINLSRFFTPSKTAEKCVLNKNERVYENLFAIDESIRGWFPIRGKCPDTGIIKQTVRTKFLRSTGKKHFFYRESWNFRLKFYYKTKLKQTLLV